MRIIITEQQLTMIDWFIENEDEIKDLLMNIIESDNFYHHYVFFKKPSEIVDDVINSIWTDFSYKHRLFSGEESIKNFLKKEFKNIILSKIEKIRKVKKVLRESKKGSDIFDLLMKTKLYNLMDNVTEVRYVTQRWGEHGGGERLVYLDYGVDDSLNGYNRSKALDGLINTIKREYLTDEMKKELMSISRKTKNSLDNLIRDIARILINREGKEDTTKDIIFRWLENHSFCGGLDRNDDEYINMIIDTIMKEHMRPMEKDEVLKYVMEYIDSCE